MTPKTVDVTIQEIKSDNGLQTPEFYLEETKDFAKFCMNVQGEIAAMIVGLQADGTKMAFALGAISDNKPTAIYGAKVLLKKVKAEMYITLSEGWYLEGQGKVPDILPSKSERRKECVAISVCDDTGVLKFSMSEIIRDDKGKYIDLKELPELGNAKDANFTGTLTELLQEETQH